MSDNIVPLRQQIPVEQWKGFFPSGILERPKPRRWIVDGKIPFGEVVLVAGAPKVGKSLLMQQLLTSAALGMPWVGLHTEKVRSIGLFFEDDEAELSTRQCNISDAYRADVFMLGEDLELNSREQYTKRLFRFEARKGDPDTPIPTEVWDTLWRSVEDFGYKLVVLDHARKVFGGRVLNDPEKVTNCIEACYRMVAKHGVTIVILTHTNREDPSSFTGSQAWLGEVRASMNMRYAVYDDDRRGERIPGQRVLSNLGGNYGPDWSPITLQWASIEGYSDRGIWEAKEQEALEKRPKTIQERTEFGYELLTYLGKCVSRGILVPIDETDPKSLPSRVRRWRKIPLNDLYAAQQWMLDNKLVEVVKVGSKAAIRPRGLKYPEEQPWQAGS